MISNRNAVAAIPFFRPPTDIRHNRVAVDDLFER